MWKEKLSSKIAIVGLLVLLLFLADLKFKQWVSQRSINQQEQSLKDQADALQKQNDQLNQSLSYLNSPDFKEKVARQQLGYKKNGETVYSFGDDTGSQSQSQDGQNQTPDAQKWWDYFFAD